MDKLSPAFHLQLVEKAIADGKPFHIYPLLKTLRFMDPALTARYDLDQYRLPEKKLLQMGIVAYARLKRMAEILRQEAGGAKVSVVDIGGGKGFLAHFIPEMDYFLCDPNVNSLYSQDVAIFRSQFDFAVNVHVLEHIPQKGRADFLQHIFSLATRFAILIVPIYRPEIPKKEVQELIYKHTGAKWAKEHMEYILPTREEILDISQRIGADVRDFPGSHFMGTLLTVFLNHFAIQSEDPAGKQYYLEIKEFINKHYHLLNAEQPSGDHIFLLRKRSAG